MQIDNAKYEGGKMILATRDIQAKQFVNKFKKGNYEIKKVSKKRSLDANAYCWVLCAKIGSAVGITDKEVYKQNIREGNQYIALTVRNSALETTRRVWCSRGIGWMIDVISSDTDSSTILEYYGSSIYNTKEMSEFIDRLVQDAKALEIDVMSEQERSLLLQDWEAKYNKKQENKSR